MSAHKPEHKGGKTMATGTPRDSITNLRTLVHQHTAAISEGDILLVNGHVFVAVNDSLANVDNAWIYRGKMEFPKTAALAIAIGDVCYWDDTAKEVNKTATGNTRVGICVEAAAGTDSVVVVNLNEN